MELRGADFDWDNWAGLPADLLAAAKAAAAPDGVRPSLAARALAVLRRRTNPALGAEAGTPGGDVVAGGGRGAPPEKAGAGVVPGPANGANGADHKNASNGSRGKGHGAAALPLSAHGGSDAGDSDEEAGEGTDHGGEWRRRSGSARQGGEGLRQGPEQPGLRRGAGSGTLDGGDRARGSQRRLGSGTLDGGDRARGSQCSLGSGTLGSGTLDGGERERGSRRSLGIGSRRSLDSARRHEVRFPIY